MLYQHPELSIKYMRFKQFRLRIKIIDTNFDLNQISLTPCQEIENSALAPILASRDKPSPFVFQNAAQRLLTQNLLRTRFLTQVGTRLKECLCQESFRHILKYKTPFRCKIGIRAESSISCQGRRASPLSYNFPNLQERSESKNKYINFRL